MASKTYVLTVLPQANIETHHIQNVRYQEVMDILMKKIDQLPLVELNGVKGYIVNFHPSIKHVYQSYTKCQEIPHEAIISEEKTHGKQEAHIDAPLSVLKMNLPSFRNNGATPDVEDNTDEYAAMLEFARDFRVRRTELGLTQYMFVDVYKAWSGEVFSQPTLCRFEQQILQIPTAMKLQKKLKLWLAEAEKIRAQGPMAFAKFVSASKRKWQLNVRTLFNIRQVTVMEKVYARTKHPTRNKLELLANDLDCDVRSVTRWFEMKRVKEIKHRNDALNDRDPPTKRAAVKRMSANTESQASEEVDPLPANTIQTEIGSEHRSIDGIFFADRAGLKLHTDGLNFSKTPMVILKDDRKFLFQQQQTRKTRASSSEASERRRKLLRRRPFVSSSSEASSAAELESSPCSPLTKRIKPDEPPKSCRVQNEKKPEKTRSSTSKLEGANSRQSRANASNISKTTALELKEEHKLINLFRQRPTSTTNSETKTIEACSKNLPLFSPSNKQSPVKLEKSPFRSNVKRKATETTSPKPQNNILMIPVIELKDEKKLINLFRQRYFPTTVSEREMIETHDTCSETLSYISPSNKHPVMTSERRPLRSTMKRKITAKLWSEDSFPTSTTPTGKQRRVNTSATDFIETKFAGKVPPLCDLFAPSPRTNTNEENAASSASDR